MTSPLISSLATTWAAAPQAPAQPAAQQPAPAAPAPQDSVTVGTPAEPKMGPIGKVVYGTGKALAKLGLFGGLAVGAALGGAAGFALGAAGLAMPLVGAALLGFEGADAHAAQTALAQGKNSPAFLERVQKNRNLTATSAGSHIVALAASGAAFGLGLGVVGGPAGMIAGTVGALALSGLVIFGASKAEKAILGQ